MTGSRTTVRRWLLRGALGLLVLVAAAVAILWSRREPIANDLISRELRQRGVPARFRIVSIGPRTEQLADVVIGDPDHPDLTVASATVRLSVGLGGVGVAAVDAHGVRLQGRVEGGAVHWGALDRLLPAARPGAPFALPRIDVALHDARLRLATPAGTLGAAVDGNGRLDDGFAGRIALVSPRLDLGACQIERGSAILHLVIERGAPVVDGPVGAGRMICGAVTIVRPAAELDARATARLDGWHGGARLAAERLAAPGFTMDALSGQVGFSGDRGQTRGGIDAESGRVAVRDLAAAASDVSGRFTFGGSQVEADGDVALHEATADPALRARIEGAGRGAAGTPVGPIARVLAAAADRALSRFDAGARLALVSGAGGTVLTLTKPELRSGSGAVLSAGRTARVRLANGRMQASGSLHLAGGGLPDVTASPEGTGWRVSIAPLAAGDARLVLAPVRISRTADGLSATSEIELAGPLADGRVSGLRAPLAVRYAAGAVTIGQGCTPVHWQGIAVSSLSLSPGTATLCPLSGEALARVDRGRVVGGARLATTGLTGSIGTTPLALRTSEASFEIAGSAFRLAGVTARLGPGQGTARLELGALDGHLASGSASGRFSGGKARLAAVPLLVNDGAGAWSLAGGRLVLAGVAGRVSDAMTPARLRPLALNGFGLTLADGVVTGSGTLAEPRSGARVAALTLRHALGPSSGSAQLHVDKLTFGPRLQPDQLTPLTIGVVADVKGSVGGVADISWTFAGVTSTGAFSTDKLDLAAAFGPVQGIAGTIRFDDLLAMHTPPHQRVAIASINPGVEVADGAITYQLLGPTRVAIEGGRWPFAGGALTLAPTRLDLSTGSTRRFILTVDGLDAARFIAQMELENIAVTGIFDGKLPLVFDDNGGRIVGGRLVARRGGGTLSYVGEVSNAQLGTFGKLAFDALKSLRYRSLALDLDGALDGEVVSRIAVSGINQQPVGAGKLGKGLTGLPFRFNIAVRAPFRGLMNSARSFSNPGLLLHAPEPSAVQPPASAPGARPAPR